MNPAERTLRARLAAHSSWAQTADPTSRTEKARKAANDRFLREARDLHPNASNEHLERVAEHLRKAYFARLGLASAAARRAKQKPAAPAA